MHHHTILWDLLFWFVFVCGQVLFMLRRADLARRSPLNGVGSMIQYFRLNWVTLLLRMVIEWIVFFYPYRFASAAQLNWIIQRLGWSFPFEVKRGLVGDLSLGIVSSMLLDTLAMRQTIFGITIPKLIKETIPQLPEVQQLVQHLNAK
jgi:hypothetical protein